MSSWLSFLRKHKVLNLIIVLVYYLIVVLPHEEVGKFIAKSFSKMSRDEYNFVILICTLLGLGLYLIPIILNIIRKKAPSITVFYLLINVLSAVLCFKMLFVVNVEAIHFVQYGVLCLLIFPLLQSYWKTAFWCLLLGAIDEGWQYFYLAPLRTNYYDFNDVIINLVGAGFGLTFLCSFAISENDKSTFKRSKETYLSAMVILGTLILYAAGFLIRKPMTGFWQVVHPQVTYHVIYPIEGIIIAALLVYFYSFLGKAATDQNTHGPS